MQELSEITSRRVSEDEKYNEKLAFKDDLGADLPNKSRFIRLCLPCATIPPELRDNLFIALFLMVAQQTTGINVITFYTEPLCQRMVHVNYSAQCAFSLGLAQLLFSLVASLYIIDRLPRRCLVVVTGAVMSISMLFFAIGQQVSTLLLISFFSPSTK